MHMMVIRMRARAPRPVWRVDVDGVRGASKFERCGSLKELIMIWNSDVGTQGRPRSLNQGCQRQSVRTRKQRTRTRPLNEQSKKEGAKGIVDIAPFVRGAKFRARVRFETAHVDQLMIRSERDREGADGEEDEDHERDLDDDAQPTRARRNRSRLRRCVEEHRHQLRPPEVLDIRDLSHDKIARSDQ